MILETNAISQTSTSNIEVVVGIEPRGYGEQWKERDALAQKIHDAGFVVRGVPVDWPRDHYVYYRGGYVLEKKVLQFGEGGCFNLGNDFLLVSERIFNGKYISDKLAIEAAGKKQYPNTRFHSVPVGCNPGAIYGQEYLRHIDLTCLLIPSRKLLFVDENFYDDPHARIRFERIAEKEDLTLIFHKPHPEVSFNYYPLNCLVLPSGEGREIIFANSNDPSFIKLLRAKGLDVVEVCMTQTPKKRGSIRCCTNVKRPETHLRDLIDYEW